MGAGHSHGHAADTRALRRGAALLLGFMTLEVVVGILASSLALVTDAAHMLTDVAALVLAWVSVRLSQRPASGHFTFGLRRAEVLSGLVNGTTLLVLGGWLAFEAVHRLTDPPDVDGALVLPTSLAGIAVNLLVVRILSGADRGRQDVEGSFQHVLNDLVAFVMTAVAAVVVLTTGWDRADAVASLVVVVLMGRSGVAVLAAGSRVVLEASPREIDPDRVRADLLGVPGLMAVRDLHVWEVGAGFPALTAHLLVRPADDCHEVRVRAQALLHETYGIDHTTLQTDHLESGASAGCSVEEEVPHAHHH